MLRAIGAGMRKMLLTLLAAASGACGDRDVALTGTLADPGSATHVWVMGGPERAEIAGDSFSIGGLRAPEVELRFARDEREVGRMEITQLTDGARFHLRGITVDDGLAFPSGVEAEARVRVTINGLRFGTSDAVPENVDVRAALLSRSRSGDALLVRPDGDRLPDLRVVVTPGTTIRTEDGDPVTLERADFGDTLRVVGSGEAGFVVAREIVVPRRLASPSAAADGEEDDRGGSASQRSGASSGTSPSSGSSTPSREARRERERDDDDERPQRAKGREERGPPPGRGGPPRGRGNQRRSAAKRSPGSASFRGDPRRSGRPPRPAPTL